jgi:acetyltransferase-like isoleucine patch superfamily enzyme
MLERRKLTNRIWDGLVSLFDPRVLFHSLRILHYNNYNHLKPLRDVSIGKDVKIAPNVSLRNGARIEISDQAQIGEHTSLWAGNETGRIFVGSRSVFGPHCYVTAANYGLSVALPITGQPMSEADVVVGNDCWIGTKAIILAGVTLGDGCVIGAGSVVTHSIPSNAIAAGIPAKVIKLRS